MMVEGEPTCAPFDNPCEECEAAYVRKSQHRIWGICDLGCTVCLPDPVKRAAWRDTLEDK
jgi:hypothetical protein